ncbi:MAG TPA: response regulator transcription factor [Sporichthyaceae bacterium]|nr:response regulator transcription factor [Sporichthyaceae bacterium]
MISVLVVDDQPAVRNGFTALIDASENMHLAGEAANGRQAVELARRSQPSVVLMDVRMPVLDGVAATRLICADPALAATRVLMLTTFDLDEYVHDALRAGASGFLLKDTRPRDLLHAIEVVAAGQAMLAPTATLRLIREFTARRAHTPRPDLLRELTEREREVLTLVARGRSNDQIADDLVISPLTAKTHVRNVLHKLDCRDRAALTALAYEGGLVAPGTST